MPELPLAGGRQVFELVATDGQGHRAQRYLTLQGPGAETPAVHPVAWRGRPVAAIERQGRWLVEGDIDIGRAGVVIGTSASLWPKVGGVAQVPYVVTQGNANVAPAIAQYNAALAGLNQWVPRSTEADYVDIALDPNDFSGSGDSFVGRVGGPQVLGGSILVDQATLLHEMGHVTGLWHEQSRPDRDAYVTVLGANLIKTLAPNFDVVRDNVQSFGLYDLQSIMHYQPFTFTKNGEPTLESIPPGQRMSDLGTFSPGDLDAIARLYGQAPRTVTITSNPPGLQVLVDGTAVTTPHTFAFALRSTHTLDVPAGPQLADGSAWVFGRWNDSAAAAHAITIAPGNGLADDPAAAPAIGVYQAGFVEMKPFAPFVYPTGAGTVTGTPAPQALPGLSGLYYPARQAVTLKATPAAGYAPYRMYTAYEPASLNPKTTRDPDWVLAYFTTHANTTVGTSPTGRWVWVDGNFYEGPVNWSVDYPADGDWRPGTTHHVDVQVSPQQPFSWSIRYPFTAWSDGGAFAHDITVPSGNASFTASFATEYNFAAWAAPGCGGAVTANPASPDNFYAKGATVSFDETPVAGWTFSGWQQDLSGTTHPKSLVMTDERLVVAGYDTSAVPLALTGFTPSSAQAGQAAFTLTLTGTGFTSATRVFVNGIFRAPTKVTATQIKLKMTAADVKKAGTLVIDVDNVPAGTWPCSAYAMRAFQVLAATARGLATPSSTQLAFGSQPVGTTGTPQVLTLTNTGTDVLALADPALTGPNAADYALTARTCTTALAAGTACTLTLTFTPSAKGARSAQLLLIDSAWDSPQPVTLAGTGTP